jgi:Protein of unknown function (DUF2877)
MRVSAYSSCLAAVAQEAPRRGVVHSVFPVAANILFSEGLLLSLNSAHSPALPNGLQLSAPAGAWPFSALRAGMSAILGARRLHIEALDCSLDLTNCPQWDPFVTRPAQVNMRVVAGNLYYLKRQLAARPLQGGAADVPTLDDARRRWRDAYASYDVLTDMARLLCGRGPGLTPAGDDMLVGWMACNWLLYGPTRRLLEACQQILQAARQQTHLLSVCWLGYAAAGYVALPVRDLLRAITMDERLEVGVAARAVLSMGATSGFDLIQGILLAGSGGGPTPAL